MNILLECLASALIMITGVFILTFLFALFQKIINYFTALRNR